MNRKSIMVAMSIACLQAAAFGQSFSIDWCTVDGGGGYSAGAGFELEGTIGQPDAGIMTGGSFTLTGGFWSAATAVVPPAPGDCDADGDVDLIDYADFEPCLGGPGSARPPACDCSDFDGDGDADLADFAEFQVGFTE